jgi:5'(3')-deoxyribonucleotidase
MKKLTVYVDLDGVLVDWVKGMLTGLGLDPKDTNHHQGVLSDYDYLEKLVGRAKIDQVQTELGYEFWANLEFLPWAKDLITRLKMASGNNLAFLTSPGKFADGAKGKLIWQQRYFPEIPMITCRYKGLCAGPNKYLIDDDKKQIDDFRANGGFVYQWPSQFSLFNTDWKQTVVDVGQDILNVCCTIERI